MKIKIPSTKKLHSLESAPRKIYIQLLLLSLLLYFVVPQWGVFTDTTSILVGVQPVWFLAALLWWGAGVVAAAMVYVVLGRPRLRFRTTVLVQLAASFAGRLLPSGLGTLGVYVRYLQKNSTSLSYATSIVGINQLLGFLSFLLLVGLYVFAGGAVALDASISLTTAVVIGAMIVVVVAYVGWIRQKRRIVRSISKLAETLATFRHKPLTMFTAFSNAGLISISLTFCVYSSLRAAGVDVSVYQAFMVYIGASVAVIITPTPGGVGGVEAAMVALLIGMNVTPSESLAGVLVYRFITFWLPLAVGYVALRRLINDKYL